MDGYCIDDKKKERYLAWWNRENETPMLCVYSRKTLPRLPLAPRPPRDPIQRWTDPDYVSRVVRTRYTNMVCAGDAVPVCFPNLGPDIMGAISGHCELKYDLHTAWAEPKVKDWSEIGPLTFDESNPHWKKLAALTETAVKYRKNYLVGITDLHPGTDGLVAMRGPEHLCYDLIDCPELVEKKLAEMTALYIEVYTRLDKLINGARYGRTTWNRVWSDTTYNIVSSDFSCMVGPEDYERFVAPHIQAEIDFLGRSIYHVDGVEALKHMDRILAFEKLTGVQWVPGAGKPPMREWLTVLKKIQDAGKVIEISVTEEDIKPICENLDPRGLMMRLSVSNRYKADRLVKYVRSFKAPKRIFYI